MSRIASTFGYLTKYGYTNATPFGTALRRFLRRPEPLSLLPPNSDWLHGGCLILCDALVTWSKQGWAAGGSLRSMNAPRSDQSETLYLDHAFAHGQDLGGNRYLIDGDGVQSEIHLVEKLRRFERIEPKEVRYISCERFAVGIPYESRHAKALCELLTARFGDFDTNILYRN